MNDPWDVKSVRRSGQYQSCMRLNGVPLLPPVLSKECHKEMQYYKLLAKEVEKRLAFMQKYENNIASDSEDQTDAPDLPEYEQGYDLPQDEKDYKIKAITENGDQVETARISNIDVGDTVSHMICSSKFSIDVSLTLNETNRNFHRTQNNNSSASLDLPERDCTQQAAMDKNHRISEVNGKKFLDENSVKYATKDSSVSDLFTDLPMIQDGPSSLSTKSFTGSLNNLHSESLKDLHKSSCKLVRQLSYTLLQPSPQLLAHLEHQAQNAGIEMNSISMSESLTNITSPKKRRNWDLETAKEKWSNMALELKNQKNVASVTNSVTTPMKQNVTVKAAKQIVTPPSKRSNGTIKPMHKSEPVKKIKPNVPFKNNVTSRTTDTEPSTPQPIFIDKQPDLTDQSARVRELYEKMQKQQLAQMESLMEKQKKEQLLLQQVFEEQNKMLLKQLKTICPKSSIEVKEAWGDKHCDGDRGLVSLSQLINCKSLPLPDTSSYLSRCDNVLKQSRDITGSLKKRDTVPQSQTAKSPSPPSPSSGSKTRTHSPVHVPTSRRLNYDTSVSSERENEPMLTDRTNDTLADLNVTFPSDYSEEANSTIHNSVISPRNKETKYSLPNSNNSKSGTPSRVTERNVKTEHSLKLNMSIQNTSPRSRKYLRTSPPKPEEREAATKIVAHVKGYLVRRLMRTERVQGIVQTIKDALLCALQLHQEREGIRGADVDLHRRLIQQITAACYSLHDTFVASTPAERCAMIGADRSRRHSLAARQPNNRSFRQTDVMSQSHSGVFPARAKRQPPPMMTQSNYETFSGDKSSPVSRRYMSSPRRRPWR